MASYAVSELQTFLHLPRRHLRGKFQFQRRRADQMALKPRNPRGMIPEGLDICGSNSEVSEQIGASLKFSSRHTFFIFHSAKLATSVPSNPAPATQNRLPSKL